MAKLKTDRAKRGQPSKMRRAGKFPTIGAFLCADCTSELCQTAKILQKEDPKRRSVDRKIGIGLRAMVFLCEDCILGVEKLAAASRSQYVRLLTKLQKQSAKKRLGTMLDDLGGPK